MRIPPLRTELCRCGGTWSLKTVTARARREDGTLVEVSRTTNVCERWANTDDHFGDPGFWFEEGDVQETEKALCAQGLSMEQLRKTGEWIGPQ